MQAAVHDREVIAMMINSGRQWSRMELLDEVQRRWGRDARFYNCNGDVMNVLQLMTFLEMQGRFRNDEMDPPFFDDRVLFPRPHAA